MASRCIYIFTGMALLLLQSCCDSDGFAGDVPGADEKGIFFTASTKSAPSDGTVKVGSRAQEPMDGKYVLMTHDEWGKWDIHIHHKNTTSSSDPEEEQLYHVNSGQQGSLDIEDSKKWLWRVSADGSDSHIFQAWTEPNPAEGLPQVVTTDANGVKTVDFEAGNETIWEDGDKFVGHYLNYLIGTAAGPVDYKTNGMYVPLYFNRLVSRIRITSIIRVYADGTYNSSDINISDVEFPDMYRTGTLKTHAGELADDGKAVFPEVSTEGGEKGLSIVFPNSEKRNIYTIYEAAGGLPMYVPPFKFKEAGKISIGLLGSNFQGGKEQTYNTYYADLAEVFLNRADYPQELRAGENMDIMLELKDDEVSGMYVYIRPWNTETEKDLLQHPQPGVYSLAELLDLRKLIVEGKEIPESYYKTVNGEKVIYIYNDFAVSLDGESTYYIPEGYVLDGLGHNLSCEGDFSLKGNVRNLKVNGVPVK